MLERWKLILSNWINCYFNESSNHDQNLNLESLLNIIFKLRENLNLDESKSSLLEAHTVEEFLRDKYPEFSFVNGTSKAANEEELCLSASLLLFFICVNSKNSDMKNVMCSKLSSADQETILKFSKCLMECSVITVGEVQAAITDACSQDTAAMALPRQTSVTETPPVMRSLHCEVRRLQAALDAERFDRNYLQEELSRTNSKLERLLKEKEHHKLEVLNLKAKISVCCGEHADEKHAEAASDRSDKLTRQLHQLEARIEEIQGQLDDAQSERDAYKAKMEELKHERDKWLALSQQENARVSQLSEELDTERHNVQSLKDLVAELQQHNKLNRLDASSLECDDPDASINSFQHNSSVCSEVCANVVEVQLGEERAKIVVLKQQIQSLQDQINDLSRKADTEKQTLENVVAQRENDIFNLKHRINEEIEEKNNLKAHCDNEITKLNNEINELEQKLKDNNEYSRSAIEKKMAEIQTLQEEKISLLHSLNNETTKLENIIKDLKSELDLERKARSSMKEGYENHLMKLNEKVLNRNNELVELQNSIFVKGEQIETLQIELRNEREDLKELKIKYQNMEQQMNTIDSDLQHKRDEVQNLHTKIQQNNIIIEHMNMEIIQLKTSISSLNENCKTLEDVKKQLMSDIQNRDAKIEEALKDINNINEVFQKEKEKLLQDMDERNATVNSLQIQLQNEIQFKVGLQNELTQLQITKTTLSQEFDKLNSELCKLKLEIQDKDKTIDAMDLYIQEEKKRNEQANEKIQNMTREMIAKENDIKNLIDKLETTTKSLQVEIQNNVDNTEMYRNKLIAETAEKETLQFQLHSMLKEKSHVEKDLAVKCEEILMLRDECEELSQKLDEKESCLKGIETKLYQECQSKSELAYQKEKEINGLQSQIVELKSNNEKVEQHLRKGVELKTQMIKTLEKDNEQLHHTIEENNSRHENDIKEKKEIIDKLEQQVKDNIIKFEDLRHNSESLNLAWENYKSEAKAAVKEKENKIAQLSEMALTFEQKINEVEQEKDELTKHIAEIEGSMNIMLENLAAEEMELRDTLESEKAKLFMQYETVSAEKENLLAVNATLTQELTEEISLKNIAEEEKNILLSEKIEVKQQLNKEMETVRTLLREKDCITQQLIEEKSAKEISEQEKELLVVEKESLGKRLVESEKTKLDLCQEILKLNQQLEVSQQNLTREKERLYILKNENKNLGDELKAQSSFNNNLLEENRSLINENDILKKDLCNANVAQKILEGEKHSLEMCLLDIKSACGDMKCLKELTEKEKELLIAEKQTLQESLLQNENVKSELCNKIDILKRKVEVLQQDLNKEKDAFLILQDKNKYLSDELNKKKICNDNLLENNHILDNENSQLKKDLQKANSVLDILEAEKKSLEISLHTEKSAHDEIETEKNNLAVKLQLELINKDEDNDRLAKEYEKLKETYEALLNENESKKEENRRLCKELGELKQMLLQNRAEQEELKKEKHHKQEEYKRLFEDFEELKDKNIKAQNDLMKEKETMVEKNKILLGDLKLLKEMFDKSTTAYEVLLKKCEHKEYECKNILEEYEKLKETFEESKQEHETLVKEKDCLLLEMKTAQTVMAAEKESLDKALNALGDQIQSEKNALAIKFELDLINKDEEKKDLLEEIRKLRNALDNDKSVQDIIIKDKEMLVAEKYSLVTSLSIEKCARDEMETEKYNLKLKLEDLSTNHQQLQETNNQMLKAIRDGLMKIAQKLKGEDLSDVVVQKFIDDRDLENVQLAEAYDLIFNIAENQAIEISVLKELEVELNKARSDLRETLEQKEKQIFELQTEVNRLQQVENEHKIEQTKQSESYVTSMNFKIKDIQALQQENQTLHNDLNDVKVQLEVKVHSLKEKLTDNENLTDKLKQNYECQIANLNVMITKLSNFLKDKTVELEAIRKDKEVLQQTVADSCRVIKTLEEKVKAEKENIKKMISDFDSERQVLKNMVTVTESVMEDEKVNLNKLISEHLSAKDCLQVENNELKNDILSLEKKYQAQELVNASLLSLLRLERQSKNDVEKESETVREYLDEIISYLGKERNTNISVISALEFQEKILAGDYEKIKNDLESAQKCNHELKVAVNEVENELKTQKDMLQNVLEEKTELQNELQAELTKILQEKLQVEKALKGKSQNVTVIQLEIKELKNKVIDLVNAKSSLESERMESLDKIIELTSTIESMKLKHNDEIANLKSEIEQLQSTIEENKTVITNLEQLIKHELEENGKLRDEIENEKLIISNKYSLLQSKTESELEERQKEIVTLRKEVEALQCKVELCEQESKAKDGLISRMSKDKDAVINTISKELVEEKVIREKYEKELETQKSVMADLKNNMEIKALRKENEQLIRAIGQQATLAALSEEKTADKYVCQVEQSDHNQVDNSSSDNTHSSSESLKTITDLEKIIHDRNRTITSLQTDITYLKSLVADSETSLMDVRKELEVSQENCQQLSCQLKKIVYQKNEEIAELKKQVTKMSVTENRASQIIKVSAKYQAMILKRIAEIKSNTILKELTNFGNSNDNDIKRSLNAGTITMEDLENFLDTTDRHLKRCSEKQIALQKERERLTEVNRINESEIINLKKFLTELSVSFQTFNSMKDLYGHKLSRVVSVQRTVRREILNLDGRISDAAMCKLERGYGAAMQDLSECTMNLERWVERCISRTVSVEKIKQAFTSDSERSSLASPTFQNTGLEIQLEELEKSFQKLLEEVARAAKEESGVESQSSTLMEVRAEYEDKLNRMKAKMKDLFNEQMTILKHKQREEIGLLERELQKTRDRMEESKRTYESYIKDLSKELWRVGEKFLVKNDEAEWLRKKQRSGSLMSLQHVHSSGLALPPELPSRPSDAHSLRSLPVVTENNTKNKREGRGLHMSDEEGEVFDNRWLKELASTPRRDPPPGQRLSELKWRNSLCPPHLKSSYPAETQFAPVLDEEEIKATGASGPARPQRKEVGITAYKKPGPPTPSKQAGRLSATDSELRESLRVEGDPNTHHADRKTSTPGRLRAFLRFNKNDTNEGTPRTRRLSNIFRKKQ